jgi:hypothetical protein
MRWGGTGGIADQCVFIPAPVLTSLPLDSSASFGFPSAAPAPGITSLNVSVTPYSSNSTWISPHFSYALKRTGWILV